LQKEEKIADLERECQILKEANEQLLSNAFNLEKEREWRSKEKALKLQIAQLEATLKADVSEKGGILDKLCDQTGSYFLQLSQLILITVL
jgi:protein fantom